MKILSLFILLPLLSMTNVESGLKLSSAQRYEIQESEQLSQYFQLEMLIDIPANSMPKKSFVTVSSGVGGYAFKSFSFQDIKAFGNAMSIAVDAGAKFHYADKILDESFTENAVNMTSGNLSIEIINKKGKTFVSNYVFKWGVATRIYFDEKESSYFTITPTYSLVEE